MQNHHPCHAAARSAVQPRDWPDINGNRCLGDFESMVSLRCAAPKRRCIHPPANIPPSPRLPWTDFEPL